MPAFHQRQMASEMPLTPPDSGSGFAYSSMHYAQNPYASHQSTSQTRHSSGYDYQQPYMRPAVAPAPPAYQYPQTSYQTTNSLPPIQNYYEPIGAPILPPLRIQEHASFADDYQRRLRQEQASAAAREQQRLASKEEKATGGVSAKLDYDMEHMTDFVTDATQTIFQHSMQSQSSFRKWIHQVLSATRLPSATILLSLHYLNDRIANFPETVVSGETQIHRLLAVSLILGSKFLDDNTFVNRSWSDVTAIKVQELNLLEMKWLQLIKYELHIDPHAQNGIQAWLDAWREYDLNYDAKHQQQHNTRLSPLDTNVYRQSGSRERYSAYPTPYSASTSSTFDTPQSSQSSTYGTTPYLSSDPWAQGGRHTFDEFYKPQHRYPALTETNDVNRKISEDRGRPSVQSAYGYQHAAPPNYYQTPTYGSAWEQTWNGMHRHDCSCNVCTYQHYRSYPLASSYTAQTVMG